MNVSSKSKRSSKLGKALMMSLVFGAGVLPGAASALDSFNTDFIDTSKWVPGTVGEGATLIVRDQKNSLLKLGVGGFGRNANDQQRSSFHNEIRFAPSQIVDPKAVTIKAKITSTTNRGCNLSTVNFSRSQMRQVVFWFNDGSSTGPADRTGDIATHIALLASPFDSAIDIFSTGWRCSNADCSSTTRLNRSKGDQLGRISRGQTVELKQELSAGRDAITMSATIAGQAVRSATYPFESTVAGYGGPPIANFSRMDVLATPQNCNQFSSDFNRPYSEINVDIDKVTVTRF